MGQPIAKREEKLDLAARAAWLYYVAGNTQQELAKKLQISRPVAQRLVALALQHGIVKVRVHHGVTHCLEIASKLRQKYQLLVLEVVPANEDNSDQVLRKIAVAGAQVMEAYLSRFASAYHRAGLGPHDSSGNRRVDFSCQTTSQGGFAGRRYCARRLQQFVRSCPSDGRKDRWKILSAVSSFAGGYLRGADPMAPSSTLSRLAVSILTGGCGIPGDRRDRNWVSIAS